MKPYIYFFLLLTIVFPAACKKTVSSPGLPTYHVLGNLVYRAACEGGPVVPFQGVPDASGPLLYLTDSTGTRVSTLVRPDAAGRFVIPKVRPGSYRLRLKAGELEHLWFGERIPSLPVTVGDDDLSTGYLCADAEPLTHAQVSAHFGDDWSEPTSSGTLPVWAGAAAVTFSAWRAADDGRQALQAEWDPVAWPAEVSSQVISGRATDNQGSWVDLHQELAVYGNRAPVKRLTGWISLAETESDGLFNLYSSAGTWSSDRGLLASVPNSTGSLSMHVNMWAQFNVTAPATFVAPFVINRLAPGAVVELALCNEFRTLFATRITRLDNGYTLSVHGEDGAPLRPPVPVGVLWGEPHQLSLQYDPQSQSVVAGFGTNVPMWALHAQTASLDTSRVAPCLAVYRDDNQIEEAISVRFAGISTNQETNFVRVRAAPGVLNGVPYDHAVCWGQPRVFFHINGHSQSFSTGEAFFSTQQPRVLSRALVTYQGCQMTVFTDVSYEEAVAIIGSAPDDWATDVMVPVSDGGAFLY